MPSVESSPPVSEAASLAFGLSLAALHLWRPILVHGHAFLGWRGGLALIATSLVVAILYWLSRSRRYVLGAEHLHVFRAVGGKRELNVYSLAELTSVGVVGERFLGNTVVVAAFGKGREVRVPGYYRHSRELFRSLFTRLGVNVTAKSAA
jgi:hypothetical protein